MKKTLPLLLRFLKNNVFFVYSFLVLAISFFTYFFNYQNPPAPFWDENFHVAAAERYLQNTFFVELHPPLGKLLIAAGEGILQPNKDFDKSYFVETDYIQKFPEAQNGKSFSFVGYRLFPAIFSFLSAYLFFLLLFLISKNTHLSFLFSTAYLFNNAFIVHFRGAMLDGIQLFFILLGLVYFVYLYTSKRYTKFGEYLILGLLVGFAVSVKINSLILGLVFPTLFIRDHLDNFKEIPGLFSLKTRKLVGQFLFKSVMFGLGIVLIFGSVQYIHMSLTRNQLAKKGAYNDFAINSEYKSIVDSNGFYNPLNAWKAAWGWYQYQSNYNKGVPKLDVTKPTENGSYPTNWVVGTKAINYRWQRYPVREDKHFTYSPFEVKNEDTIKLEEVEKLDPNERKNWLVVVQYLYLQVNPAIALVGILGLIFSLSLIVSRFAFSLKISNPRRFWLIVFFSFSYVFYMFTVLSVQRVLYMYHYFIPMTFSLILGFLIFIDRLESVQDNPKKVRNFYILSATMASLIFALFIFYAPFTYYLPLSEAEFNARNWFEFWGLKRV